MVSDSFFIEKNTSQTNITNQQMLSYFPEDVVVQKNEFGVPFLYQQEKKLPISVSTSHHGNYGGFAFLHT
jgi:hypothetical protein